MDVIRWFPPSPPSWVRTPSSPSAKVFSGGGGFPQPLMRPCCLGILSTSPTLFICLCLDASSPPCGTTMNAGVAMVACTRALLRVCQVTVHRGLSLRRPCGFVFASFSPRPVFCAPFRRFSILFPYFHFSSPLVPFGGRFWFLPISSPGAFSSPLWSSSRVPVPAGRTRSQGPAL